MSIIKCCVCRQCNRKGKPSVSRGSAYCDSHIKTISQVNRSGLFSRFKDFLNERRSKYDKEGNLKEFKQKGFRMSYFLR